MDSVDAADAENGDMVEEQLRARIRQLEDQLELHKHSEEQFAQIVNDLNNLLAVMRGHAQLAREESGRTATEELARIILSSTARAQEIIKRALRQDSLKTDATEKLKDAVRVHGASILVVDDEESIGILMYNLLTKAGYDVSVARSGQAALEAARGKVYDLAFMDIILGDMNGVEAFRQLRQISPATRVVFLSGDPSIEVVRRTVRDEGADGFITKPFDIYELQNLISYIIKRAPASTQA